MRTIIVTAVSMSATPGINGRALSADQKLPAPALEIVFEAGAQRPQATAIKVFADRRVEYSSGGKLLMRTQIAAERYGAFLDFIEGKGLPRNGKATVAAADPKQDLGQFGGGGYD